MENVKLFEVESDILGKVLQTFNKTEESLHQEVTELTEWLKKQPHLPEVMDEKLIQNFLIFNKFKTERTKQRIDNYYTIRGSSDIFKNINPKLANMKKIMDTLYYTPLPKLTPEMYRVLFVSVRNKDLVDEMEPYDVIRHFINVMEVRLHEDVTYGDVIIVDCKDITWRYIIKVTPLCVYRFIVTVYQKLFSMRLKAMYLINTPKFGEIVVELMRKFSSRMANRFHICKDPNIVRELLPEDILPVDYGGKEKSLEELNDLLSKKFAEYQDRFDALDTFEVDESLRPNI